MNPIDLLASAYAGTWKRLSLSAAAIGLAVSVPLAATAGDSYSSSGKATLDKGIVVETEEKSVFDKIWELPVLYDNEDNPIIQKVQLIGRYQGQWHYTDLDRGSNSGWENRRWRLGTKIQFLENFKFESEFNLKTNYSRSGRFFRNFDTMFIEWKPQDDFALAIGKIKPKITQEYHTSSRHILTFERSLLVNQTTPAKIWGAQLTGTINDFDYRAAVFTTGLDRDWLTPEFNGGYSLLASVGRDISDATNVRLDYLYANPDEREISVRDTKHLVSLNSTNKWDRLGLNTDLIYGRTRTDSDNLYGIVLMPYYDITDQLQFVFRYHFAASSSDDGLRAQSRYERPAIDDGGGNRGDRYNSFYTGLNYYIYGQKLKIMNGLEYATMSGDDYNGWTFLTGVRLYF